MVVVVNNPAHSDVGAYLQRPWQRYCSVASPSPVVVLHLPAVHWPYTSARLHPACGVHDSIVERYEYGCGLEYRAWFQEVADGMVLYLPVFAVYTFLHVHYGLDVACGHLHDYCHSYVAVNLLQLLYDGAFGQVLHPYVNSGDDVGTIDRWSVHDVEELVQHLPSVYESVGTSQYGVVSQLQSASGRVLCTEHVAERTTGQRAVRALAGVVLLSMKSAGKLSHLDDGQLLYFLIGVVVHAPVPYRPMAFHVVVALLQVLLECRCRLLGKYGVKPHAYRVYLGAP